MLNAVYQLKRPRQFELVYKDITFDKEHAIVRPTHLSICNADQRYYQGTRPEEVLKKKLPMALIHEGIGQVIYDPSGEFQVGDQVVMIPNLPCETDPVIAENYLRIFMLLTFANGIQPMSSSFFTSIGKARLGIIMSLTRQVIFLLPLVIIFPIFMGIDGVMYAGPIADAAAFILAVLFARKELGIMKNTTT